MTLVTAREIAALVGGEYSGDPEKTIAGVRPIVDAGESDLTFLSNPKYARLLDESRAGLVLVGLKTAGDDPRFIRVKDPYYAVALTLSTWFSAVPAPEGLSAQASISPDARIGERARIGPFVTIDGGAVIGDDVTIMSGSFVGRNSTIGDGSWIYPNVTLYHGTVLGRRCIIHSGTVIGADGYGYATSGGIHHKIPQIGIVRIEDDVEIGATTTIDRAALGETFIGEGTKIDNLVQIGHNVRIGKRCLIVAQTGIAGSTEIGDDSVFAGNSGTYGHLKLGAGLRVGACAVVTKNWPGNVTLAGFPARELREHLRSEATMRRLPELFERLAKLENEAASRTSPENFNGETDADHS